MNKDNTLCLGQFVSSKTLAEFDQETGYWTFSSDVQEGRKFINDDWKFKTISARSIDKSLQDAQVTVTKSILSKLEELKGDLWSLPDGRNDGAVPSVFESSKNSTA